MLEKTRAAVLVGACVLAAGACTGDLDGGGGGAADAAADGGGGGDGPIPGVDAAVGSPDALLPVDAIPPADVSTACSLPAAGSHTLDIDVDGQQRSYILYVPSGLSLPAPFVVALHGNGDTASNFLSYSQLGQSAQTNGFLLAVPQAIPDSAPYGVDWDAYTEPPSSNKDYRFVEEVRNAWAACADSARVYVLGYSQGGFLAFYVGMKDAGELGAIHVQSAANPLSSALITSAPRQIPVQLRIGTEDSLLQAARDTRDALQASGFTVDYAEISDHGHCCYLSSLNPEIWAFFAAHPL